MNNSKIKIFGLLLVGPMLLTACSVNKLEARIEADPQCKPTMNAKTGALMPCPGSDKAFYKSVALTAAPSPVIAGSGGDAPISQDTPLRIQKNTIPQALTPQSAIAPSECKPQIHQKTGTLMPCPAP